MDKRKKEVVKKELLLRKGVLKSLWQEKEVLYEVRSGCRLL